VAVDEAEFEQAFDRMMPRAAGLAMRLLGDRRWAEAVATEALARAYASWERVRSLPSPDVWVLRAATHLALERAAQQASPPELTASLLALPTEDRDAVILRYLTDLPDSEIGPGLDAGPSDLQSRVARGLAALRSSPGPGRRADVGA
jgi:RNA polymerase sigma-70 factor (ECF subfamily)